MSLRSEQACCHLVLLWKTCKCLSRELLSENKRIDKYLNLARELNNLWNKRMKMILIVIGALQMVSKGLKGRLEKLETSRRIETITAIGQNTQKSPGGLERLAITQTPVKRPPANAGVKNSQRSKITIETKKKKRLNQIENAKPNQPPYLTDTRMLMTWYACWLSGLILSQT